MRSLAIAVVLISGTILFAATPASNVAPLFQAFCNDGDGPLSGWVNSRYEAYLIGRDHELVNRGHRWDILVQSGETVSREPTCARLADGTKPDTIRLDNLCDKCVKFTVSRTTADGTVKSREIKIDAKKSRQFRKLPDAVVKVEGERDCSE
ncbi:MAG TPA: hypothetical protein VNA17_11975 [Pyrinomonadaceae bacterium]|nr:hypothetical protein [Pyrinomonadaceae bacterium]